VLTFLTEIFAAISHEIVSEIAKVKYNEKILDDIAVNLL
jgi:hypothetical protein